MERFSSIHTYIIFFRYIHTYITLTIWIIVVKTHIRIARSSLFLRYSFFTDCRSSRQLKRARHAPSPLTALVFLARHQERIG